MALLPTAATAEGIFRPLPCQVAMGEDWVLLGPPWQLYPFPPAAATPAP